MTRPLAAWALALFAALAFAAPAAAEIYRWVDDVGVPHWTGSLHEVPFQYRDQLRDVSDEYQTSDRVNEIPQLSRKRTRRRAQRAAAAIPGPTTASPQADRPAEAPRAAGEEEDAESIFGGLGSAGLGMLLPVALALPFGLAIGALVLKLACRIVGADAPGFGWALMVVLVQWIATVVGGGILGVGLMVVVGSAPAQSLPVQALSLAASLAP